MRLIDADALIERINEEKKERVNIGYLAGLCIVEIFIDEAPTVEPKKGKWVIVDKGIYTAFECDQCGFIGIGINSLSNFCPCCGADMIGGNANDKR